MKYAYLSELAGLPLKTFLKLQNYNVNLVDRYGRLQEYTDDCFDHIYENIIDSLKDPSDAESAGTHVDPRICTHADLYMCQLGLWDEAGLFVGDPDKLSPDYPKDVIYNAVCTRNFYVHLIPGTDDDLVNAMMSWRRQLVYNEAMAQRKNFRQKKTNEVDFSYEGNNAFSQDFIREMKQVAHHSAQHLNEQMKVIGTNQGYSRCSCLPVDNNSFITSDEGLATILENQGADVLRIRPGHIELPGFDYGFIGGCAGHIYVQNEGNDAGIPDKQRAIVFNGDLTAHPDGALMIEYIQSRNIYPIYFNSYPLEDIGSILATE